MSTIPLYWSKLDKDPKLFGNPNFELDIKVNSLNVCLIHAINQSLKKIQFPNQKSFNSAIGRAHK
jgi:hypothetical protein